MNYSVLQSLANPDAITYFMVNSGIFLLVAACVFFVIGISFGRLVWGRDRAKLRNAEHVIENFKDEVAALKRRIAEGVSLPGRHFGPSLPLALSVQSTLKGPFYPVSRMFYTWGERDWQPPKIQPQPQHASRAFTVWTHAEYDQPIAALFTASQAFTLWTDRFWEPQPVRQAPLPPSQAFGLWTEPDAVVHPRALFSPNAAFTIWTLPEWTGAEQGHQPVGPSQAFSIWTEPDFFPPRRILFSTSAAFTLWTEEAWTALVRSEPLPPSQAFTVWATPVPLSLEEAPPPAPSEAVERQSLRTSVFSRAINVARGALRRNRPADEAPASLVAPEDAVLPPQPTPPAIVPWDSEPELIQRWHRLPLSQAFTLWTVASWEPAARITFGHHPIANGARVAVPVAAPPEVTAKASAPEPPWMERKVEEQGAPAARIEIPAPQSLHEEPVYAEPESAPESASFAEPPPPYIVTVIPAEPQVIEPAESKQEEKEEPIHHHPAVELPAPPIAETEDAPSPGAMFADEEAPALPHTPVASPEPALVYSPPLEPSIVESKLAEGPAEEPSPEPPLLAPMTPVLAAPELPQAELGPPALVAAERPGRHESPRQALIPSIAAASPSGGLTHAEIAPFPFLSEDPEALPDSHVSHWYHKDAAGEGLRQDARLGMVYDTTPEGPDDLTAVSGISADRAQQLNSLGVYYFKQIALWGDTQMREFALRLGMRERFIREHWIEQARALHFHRHRERI